MKVYLVIDPSWVTGRDGCSKAMLDVGFPRLLSSFGHPSLRRRNDLIPVKSHSLWDKQYQPPNGPIKK